MQAAAIQTAPFPAYDVVRAMGAAYLVWLGTAMLWRTRRHGGISRRDGMSTQPATVRAQESMFRSWLRGATTNLLNPKIGAFYVAMLPQFIPAHTAHLPMGLALAGIHDAEGLIWFTALISAAHLARRFLDSSRTHKIMDRITGTVLIGFGLKLALSNR